MEEDTVVRLPRPGASVTEDPLLEVLRSGARQMLQQVIEAEVEAFLAAHAELEDGRGRQKPGRPEQRAIKGSKNAADRGLPWSVGRPPRRRRHVSPVHGDSTQ